MPKRGDVIFGTDGFRGEYTEESGPALLNIETIADLTRAFVEYAKSIGDFPAIVVGRDTRESGQVLAKTVCDIASKLGLEVWDVGVCPTPATFKIAQQHGTLAIMITASHNPHTDNGWKAAIKGDKITDEQARIVSDIYWKNLDQPIGDTERAEILDKSELRNWYIDEVVKDICDEFGENPLIGKVVVVDGANGATAKFTPEILRRLGAEVHEFATDCRAHINLDCGAADLSGVKNFLKNSKNILNNPNLIGAVSNDGDGDRIMCVGVRSDGSLVELNGNYVLHALAENQPGIVGTLYTNSGLVEALRTSNIGFDQCANGDTAVTAGLRARQKRGENWTRGGEYTGHHVDTDWLSSGDGVRMAAWYSSYVSKHGKKFNNLYDELALWPEVSTKIKISRDRSEKLENQPEVQNEIERLKQTLGNNGRLVVRTSGTEPVVRIWGEAKPPINIQEIIDNLSKYMGERA